MYAIIKTGGKQYKVSSGDILSIEKLDAEVGDEVELPVICVVDGETVEADPDKASGTTVTALVVDQYKGKKQLVFKFKKRKGYKKLKGHRQQLTKVQILGVGSDLLPEDKRVWLTRPEDEETEDAEEASADKASAKEDAADAAEKAAEEATEDAAKDDAEEAAEEAAEAKDAAEDTAEDVEEDAAAEQETSEEGADDSADAAAEDAEEASEEDAASDTSDDEE